MSFLKCLRTTYRDQGLKAHVGQTNDTTLVPALKQRNSGQENKEIKANRLPDGWNKNPKRLQQRDLDARWVKKMISTTMVIRTAFALMLSTVL